MPPFMHKREEENSLMFDLVINIERETAWHAAAWKSVGAHVVAPTTLDHFPHLIRYALSQVGS